MKFLLSQTVYGNYLDISMLPRIHVAD